MIWPVVAYAPKAATKPSIAAQPLNFSASGVMRKKNLVIMLTNVNQILKYVKLKMYGLHHQNIMLSHLTPEGLYQEEKINWDRVIT